MEEMIDMKEAEGEDVILSKPYLEKKHLVRELLMQFNEIMNSNEGREK